MTRQAFHFVTLLSRNEDTYPDIQLGTLVLLPLKDLRGSIGWASTPCGQRLSGIVEVPETKVCERYGGGG